MTVAARRAVADPGRRRPIEPSVAFVEFDRAAPALPPCVHIAVCRTIRSAPIDAVVGLLPHGNTLLRTACRPAFSGFHLRECRDSIRDARIYTDCKRKTQQQLLEKALTPFRAR